MLSRILQRTIISKIGRIAVAFVAFFLIIFLASTAHAGFWGSDAKLTSADFNLAVVSETKDFQTSQSPQLEFKFSKKRNLLAQLGASIKSVFVDEYKNIKIEPSVVGAIDGKPVSGIDLKSDYLNDGKFSVSLSGKPRQLKPGKYRIKVNVSDTIVTGGEAIQLSQDFSWGVLAFNSNKSIYSSSEAGYLQMAVLDDEGHTLCDADLNLVITAPDGKETVLTTIDKSIIRNSACGPDNVIKTPDYSAFYSMDKVGQYQVKLTADTKNGTRSIADRFEVRDSVPFDIERFGPTRVFPKADYTMKVKIKANEDYSGDIVDIVPSSFKITNYELIITNKDLVIGKWLLDISGDEQRITIPNVDLKTGDEVLINYTFDAPDISPDFYLVGPAEIGNFKETRQWQIASDALSTDRVKTVQFLAGTYSANGTTGQNSDTNQTFSTFSIQLPETGVSIKNAYVVFESQYEAYANNAGSYTGYTLAFDAFNGSVANAWTGTSTASNADTTILSGNELESNHQRLLLDVTGESNLASYAGNNDLLTAQVGYRINRGAAVNSIATAKAVLYVTYVYDRSSPSIANTVIYPLESSTAGDSGSKKTSQATNCVFNSTCPSFNYSMDIPEYSTATGSSRLSQWFQMYNQTDLNLTNDVTAQVQIGTNPTSANFIHESALSDNGNMPVQYFSGVSGFAENTAQAVQYRLAATAGTFYLEGGEVAETYTASSSAVIKTRTVSFPIGVLTNGLSTASSTGFVNVFFPENGPTATGTVSVKKAWVRVISNNYFNGAYTMGIATKVGDNASSTGNIYNYNPAATVAKPSFNFIHIIPSSDYPELESANASVAKTVILEAQHSNATYPGGISAELMITYAYSSEQSGYLASVNLYGGQMNVAPGTVGTRIVTLSTANSILPETVGSKTMLAGGLLASYLHSDTDGNIAANYTVDSNLSTGVPSCTASFVTRNDAVNGFFESYKNVLPALSVTNNQAYSACYANNGGGDTSGGSKMNGQLIYTYKFENTPPTSTIISAVQKTDGSGAVDISIVADDADTDTLRAMVEYATGTSCVFPPSGDPSIDETPANVSASNGTVIVDDASAYQVGTSTGWISTTAGVNTVNFDWLSKINITNATGTYCVRLTANDGYADQLVPATTTVYIDNLAPVFSSASIPDLAYKIGDTVTATITMEYDPDTYTLASSSLNTATSSTSNLQKINDTTYTVDYLVTAGNPDRAAGTIPYQIVLKDPYGNTSTSTGTFANGSIDANYPSISNVQIPDRLYKIGDTVTATITVAIDTDAYSLASSSINTATSSTSNLVKINSTTYTLDYLVAEGQPDRTASGTIPFSIQLIDERGNVNPAYNGTSGGKVDAHAPAISSANIANGSYKIGSAIDVIIVSNDASSTLGTTSVNGKSVGGFINQGGGNYKITYTVADGDTDRSANTIPVSIILIDEAGNASSAFTTPSANSATVDAHKPNITSITILDLAYKVGNVIRATATVDIDALGNTYTLGTSTVNGVNVTNLQKVNGTTYTFDYTVVNGNADHKATGTIPYSIIFRDDVLQENAPFAGNFADGSVDANKPAISNVTFNPSSGVLAIGSSTTATIFSDETGYAAGTMTVNSKSVAGTLVDLGSNNYTVVYTVQSGDSNVNDLSDLPVSLVLVDAYGNQSDAYATPDTGGRPGVDATRPSISSVTIPDLAYKVGDTMHATITVVADSDAYQVTSVTINSVNAANLTKVNDTTYTIDYAVTEGDADHSTGTIPYDITLHDSAGNDNSPAYAGNFANGSVDANTPAITDYQIPIINFKVGDTITATITVSVDADIYVISSSTINDVPTTNLVKVNDTTYTVQHLITEGETDRTNGNIPYYLQFRDKQGNINTPYSGNSGGSIDANSPAISNVTFLPSSGILKIGDTATATIISNGVNYTAGTMTINGQDVSGTLSSAGGNDYTVRYTVQAGDQDIVEINNLPVDFVLLDTAGNSSAHYTVQDAAGRPGVDAHAPAISNYQIPISNYKIGDTITATITVTADSDVYAISSSTINDVPTTNLQKVNDTTYTVDHVVQAGETDRMNGNVPFYVVFSDTAGNTNAPYSGSSGGSIDANAPIITNYQIPITSYKIGDTITATITVTADSDVYAISSSTINDISTTNFQKINDTTYTVDHVVQAGETDRTNGNVPFYVVFSDTAGNTNAPYSGNSGGSIDAHAPTVPGPLSFVSHTTDSITLDLGATTTEDNFKEYKIYYKIGSSGVTESDSLWGSSSDASLGDIVFNGATTTTVTGLQTDTQYVFNIWAYDTAGNAASSTELSRRTNGAPNNLGSLGQFKDDGTTAIVNGYWTTENSVKLTASANDPNADEIISLYFEFIPDGSAFTTATSEPTGACVYGTAYGSCGTNIWFVASSSPANYSVTPFTDTVSITSVPDSSTGYKWQVIACDLGGDCSAWEKFNLSAPNIKVDTADPSAPGNLTVNSKTSTSVTLNFGATTTEANFSEYRIYYKEAASGVAESDQLHGSSTDSSLGFIDFNGKATTTVENLTAGTTYVFNIWAYDQAGNKASATEVSTSTPSSANAPTGSFNSIASKTDGSGAVDISITVDDADNNALRARIDYVAGTGCDFSSPLDPTLDETPANISATHGTVEIDNASLRQVGTSTGMIETNSGPNMVNFDWLSKTDVPSADGYYCLRLTANDGLLDQAAPATTTVYIDNTDPTAPGNLSLGSKSTYSLTLGFGATTTDTNFNLYKIFYKAGASGVTEGDTEKSDGNLLDANFNGATSTTVSGLQAGTQYVFNIWAYDNYGNKTSATEFSATTNYIPGNASSLSQLKNNGTTPVANGGWTTENNVKLRASVIDSDNPETVSLYFQMIPNGDSFLTATTVPVGACNPTEDFSSCASKVWIATSTSGNYSATPFTGTVNPSNIPDSATGYKWQVLSCDSHEICSSWMNVGTTPNFKVDTAAPTAPGNLSFNAKTATTVTLNLGATTTETNFAEYRIYYKQAASGVTEGDSLFSSTSDANLGYINYNGASTVTVTGLQAGLQYVFNIWAYDQAGNKANATEISITSNTPPTGNFVSAVSRIDGTGVVDISFQVDDANDNDTRAKIEYVAGAGCDFTSPLDPTIDATPGMATSSYGTITVDNATAYQIGTSTGVIKTDSGANVVNFDWQSMTDLPAGDGVYCLRLTVNDGADDQAAVSTTTVTIDNLSPTAPGELGLFAKTASSLILSYGATTTETNFKEYKVYYKQGAGTVTENDSVLIDTNLSDIVFNNIPTTSVSGLLADNQYSFKIFAYDDFGNKSSANQVTFKTNAPPTGLINSIAQKTDGSGAVDISIQIYDIDGDLVRAKLEFATGTTCDFTEAGDPTLDETPSNITSTYGTTSIDNLSAYQIGTGTDWIITSSGANTVNFDWQTKSDLPTAEGSYCVRLTANDSINDQSALATSTVYIDNVNPTAPGSLSMYAESSISITLNFGATTTENNFSEYKIFYKQGSSGVDEQDTEKNKFDDPNLGFADFNGATTTLIENLIPSTEYVFNIWAYDQYGNKSSSTSEFSTTTIGIQSATWREAEDTVDPTVGTAIGKESPIRVRIAMANKGDWQMDNHQYRLQYSLKGIQTCDQIAAWTNIPVFGTGEHFEMVDSPYFTSGASTSQRFLNSEGYAFTPGYMIERNDDMTGPQSLAGQEYTEIEYAFQPTVSSNGGKTYCFRAINSTVPVDTYDTYPELTIAPPPSVVFNSAALKGDGSGIADISFTASSDSGTKARVKLEYVAGADCNFASPLDPTLDESQSNISATYGSPYIENASAYQIGTTTNHMVVTAYGPNTVSFDWDTETDLPTSDGTYCLRATANDGLDDQVTPATTTIIIDHVAPTTPGDLTLDYITANSASLKFGTSSVDSNFKEYRIYYKEGSSGVTESDTLWSSSSDPNLGFANHNGATTTNITGLLVNHQYVFKIWAYDQYGNKSFSSGEQVVFIKHRALSQNWQFFYDRQNETPTSSAAGETVAPSSIMAGLVFKLRLTLRETEGIDGENVKIGLQYSTQPDFSSGVYNVAEIGSTTPIWTYGNGVDEDNDPVTTMLLSDATVPATHNESASSTSTYTFPGGSNAEFEFTLRNNGATISTTYYFRAYDVVNAEPISKNLGESYPSLVTEGAVMSYSTQGVSSGASTEGVVTTVNTTATNIDFGTLNFSSPEIAAQRFTINTNSGEGYQLFVYQTQDFLSNVGASILPISGTNESPITWPASPYPSGFGYHTGDETLSGGSPSRFAPDDSYAKFESSMKEISYSPVPVSNKQVDFVVKLEVTNQQSAGEYQTNMVYIIVPTY